MCLAIFLLALFLVSCAPGTPGTCLRRGTGAGGVRLVSLAEGTSALAPTRFGVHCMHALTWTDTSSLWHRVHHHHHRPSVAILAQGSDIAEAISRAWFLLREPLCSSGALHCVSTAFLVLTPMLSGASGPFVSWAVPGIWCAMLSHVVCGSQQQFCRQIRRVCRDFGCDGTGAFASTALVLSLHPLCLAVHATVFRCPR